MKRLKDLDLSHLPAALEAFIRDTIPENAVVEITNADDVRDNCSGLLCEGLCTIFCPVDPPKKPFCGLTQYESCETCPATGCIRRRGHYAAARPGTNATPDKPTRSAVSDEADANYDSRKPYITPNGNRHGFVPNPEDYVKDAEDSFLEASYVATIYKTDSETGFLTPVARHGFGSTPPTDIKIKWAILRYKGDTATVSTEYGLGF